ncbi:MAG: prolyl oligopeptidase family serine peptidase [Bacteroidales bacterium]|nr:prolyl oligopeptidase family serine peptidase [Bacteroidales bacterium]
MNRLTLATALLMVSGAMSLFAADLNKPEKAVAVTQVYGDGLTFTGVALQYAEEITPTEVNPQDFSVKGRTVTGVTVSPEVTMSDDSQKGRYVILHLSASDSTALLKTQALRPGGGPRGGVAPQVGQRRGVAPGQGAGPGGPGQMAPNNHPFREAKATVTLPDGQTITTEGQVNLVVDQFKQATFTDQASGLELGYNIFVPDNIEDLGRVPMVLFMEDASCVGTYQLTPLMQGLGAVVWAEPENQAKHPCIVVAPQYPEVTVGDAGKVSPLVGVTVNLVKDIAEKYPVDTDRIYTTGQSMGGMMSIYMMVTYPDLFASAYLVACQWVVDQTAPLSNYSYWVTVSADDHKAFPTQNEMMEGLAKNGVMINRGLWDAKWGDEMMQFSFDDITSRPAQIYYTVYAPGTVFEPGQDTAGASGHMQTWRYAYTIDPIRDWLFTRHKDMK